MKYFTCFLLLLTCTVYTASGQDVGQAASKSAIPVSSALEGPLRDSLRNPDFIKRYGIVLPAGFDENNRQWVTPEEYNNIPNDRKHLFRVKTKDELKK